MNLILQRRQQLPRKKQKKKGGVDNNTGVINFAKKKVLTHCGCS